MNASGNIILLLSNEVWGPVWYSKHHYAVELARTNTVLFIGPPLPWSPRNVIEPPFQVEQVQPNLWSIRTGNPCPMRLRQRLFRGWNDQWLARKLENWLKQQKLTGPRILWQFDPNRLTTTPLGVNWTYLYHAVDPYQNFPSDTFLARRAGLVIAINDELFAYYQKLNERVLQVPHGFAPHPETHLDPAEEALRNERPYFLLVGTLSNDLDLNLLEAIGKRFPDKRLLLIGPDMFHTQDFRDAFQALLRRQPTIRHLGVRPAQALGPWMRGAVANLVLYQFGLTKTVGTRSPHKLIPYLAAGRPVVTTLSGLLPILEGKGLYSAPTPEQFLQLMEAAETGTLTVDEPAVAAYLESVRYPRLLERIFAALPA